MITIHSHIHRRGGSLCPVTGYDHGPTGTAETSYWAMHDDNGRQLSDETAARIHPRMYELTELLRVRVPRAPMFIAICYGCDFPTAPSVCQYDADPAQTCKTLLSGFREFDLSVHLPGPDNRAPRSRCARCLQREYSELDAILHEFCGTVPPAPIQPPAPLAPTPGEIAAARRQRAISDIERVLVAVGSRSRALAPREGAILIADAIETLTTLKETLNV